LLQVQRLPIGMRCLRQSEDLKVCNENGYQLDKDTSKCTCKTEQGFTRSSEKEKCRCAPNSYNIRPYTAQAGEFSFQKSCAQCREIFPRCPSCAVSASFSSGSVSFWNVDARKSAYFQCGRCDAGFFYDTGSKKCNYCFFKHGSACKSCTADQCLSCGAGYFLRGTKCVGCASTHDRACTRCTSSKCTECLQGYTLIFDSCFKNIF